VSHEDDYGFWDDDRSYSLTARRARPQRRRVQDDRAHQQGDLRRRKADVARSRAGASAARSASARLWSRLGLIALVGVLAISVAMAVSSESSLSRVAAVNVPVTSASDAAVAFVTQEIATTTASPIAPAVETTLQVATIPPLAAVPQVSVLPSVSAKAVTTVTTAKPKPKEACTKTYKVVALDYWILIAKKVNVTVKDLLAANQAKASTALYPGRTICLPANASAPKAPTPTTTTTTTSTVKPTKAQKAAVTTTTVKSAATKPKAKATAPTQPTAPPPPPLRSYSVAEVEQIIRDVWPDDLEDQALAIAKRESNLVPTAHNSCCIGLFQIYWVANQRFLSTLGISSATDLYDPRTNANAAYAIYLRSGWGPWS
jgi:LysM repeat protein